jgi:hypothetical protein
MRVNRRKNVTKVLRTLQSTHQNTGVGKLDRSLKQMDGDSPRDVHRETPIVTQKLCLDMLRREGSMRRDVDINVFQPGGIVDHVQNQTAFDISQTARLEEVTIHSHE